MMCKYAQFRKVALIMYDKVHSCVYFFSDESVAGDSGVFEAASPAKQPSSQRNRLASIPTPAVIDDSNSTPLVDGSIGGINIRETAQVLIRLKYSIADSLLYVGIEKARNLQALLVNAYPASESSRKM